MNSAAKLQIIALSTLTPAALMQSAIRTPKAGGSLNVVGRDMGRGPKRADRNSPCHCGSGKKLKKCCL